MVYLADKPFVYGDFSYGPMRNPPAPPGRQPFAIQILREYSANEFIGKLFMRSSSGNWVPALSVMLIDLKWYQYYQRNRRHLAFDMEGSGRWAVQHFRDESDETGPYLAVALRFTG